MVKSQGLVLMFLLVHSTCIAVLKPHIHDMHRYGPGNSRALLQCEICVRANSPISPRQYVSKAQTSEEEKYGLSLVHTQRCRANPHAPIKMAMRSRVMCAVIG